MTDWAKYPLEVMARNQVLNDEEVREMCAEIARLRAENRDLADSAEKYQSALHLIGKRGMVNAVVDANERAEGWRRRWCELNRETQS